MPASARAPRRSNGAWRSTGRLAALREPRRCFGIATYRSHVTDLSRNDPAAEPPGFVVVVAPGDRIHFLDWGGSGGPGGIPLPRPAGTGGGWGPGARPLRG